MAFFDELKQQSAVLLIGPPLSGQKEMYRDLLKRNVETEEPILIVTTDTKAEDVLEELDENATKASEEGRLKFIDCYAQQVDEGAKNTSSIKRISSPIALNEISISLTEAERSFVKIKPQHKVVFNSLSTMLMYSNPNMIGRFTQVITGKIKKAGGTVVFLIEEGMHDEKVIITLEHVMNAVIHVKKEAGKTMIKAKGLDNYYDWTEYA